jgi:RNA polymerase sigma factor (sigma-70 family)
MKETQEIDSQIALVNAIKSNDSKVLKSFYSCNYHKVENMVLKNSGTKDHAKDIYQEAFITVWQNIKNNSFIPQNETALQGYLYQIAKNKWMDLVKSSRFRKTKLIENESTLYDKNQNDSDEQDFLNEKLELMISIFKNLGNPCKQLLTAFYYEKKSLRNIASELQIEENTARNNKYRCMEKLRKLVLDSKS